MSAKGLFSIIIWYKKERSKMGKIYGYCRVSTKSQGKTGFGLDVQREAVISNGADPDLVFEDVFTGIKCDRPELNKLLEVLEQGDTLIVSKLDRIARSVTEGVAVIEELVQKGVTINILNMGIFDNRPANRFSVTIMLAMAEFERELIRERMQEGRAIARQKEGYREGRKPKWSIKQYNHAMNLLQNHSYKEVAETTGIPIPTLKVERRKRKDAELKTELQIV